MTFEEFMEKHEGSLDYGAGQYATGLYDDNYVRAWAGDPDVSDDQFEKKICGYVDKHEEFYMEEIDFKESDLSEKVRRKAFNAQKKLIAKYALKLRNVIER